MRITRDNIMKLKPKSAQELSRKAQEIAERESSERGIPIERICVRMTPWGGSKVIVLDHAASSA